MSEMNELMDALSTNDTTRAISDLIEQVMAIPEDSLNDNIVEMMNGIISGSLTNSVKKEAMESITKNFEDNSYTPLLFHMNYHPYLVFDLVFLNHYHNHQKQKLYII